MQIFVDVAFAETEDCLPPFQESQMYKLLDTYQFTIRVLLTVPSASEIQRFMEKEKTKRRNLIPDEGWLLQFISLSALR